jgi:hypothetical protein
MDLVGRRFSRLEIMHREGGLCICRCDCSAAVVARVADLERGHIKSCGCLKRDAGKANGTHHEPKTSPEYVAWSHFKRRGYDVCPEWASSFLAFLHDVGRRPGPDYILRRVDKSEGFTLANVEWARRTRRRRRLMSRGPGHIERTVAALFTSHPTATFSTSELVEAVYPGRNRIEKKHRVAVLRAATKLAERLGWEKWNCERACQADMTDRGCIFANVCDVHSYTLGRLRADFLRSGEPVSELERRINEDPEVAQLMARGGTWWMFVQQNRLERGEVLLSKTRRLVDITAAKTKQRLAGGL